MVQTGTQHTTIRRGAAALLFFFCAIMLIRLIFLSLFGSLILYVQSFIFSRVSGRASRVVARAPLRPRASARTKNLAGRICRAKQERCYKTKTKVFCLAVLPFPASTPSGILDSRKQSRRWSTTRKRKAARSRPTATRRMRMAAAGRAPTLFRILLLTGPWTPGVVCPNGTVASFTSC